MDIENVDNLLDRKAINAKYWNDENDLDLKRRKEAEFLVMGDIASVSILGYVVYNQEAKDRLVALGANNVKVHVKPHFYF